jgi:hypothetical protein
MEEVAQENPQHELVADNPSIGGSVPGATIGLWHRLRTARQRLSFAAQEAILVGVELLVVRENSWSGWRAWIDGQPATLVPGQWLAVALARGPHTIEFRYLPWDVPLGLLLAVAGVALALFCWFKADLRRLAPPTPS